MIVDKNSFHLGMSAATMFWVPVAIYHRWKRRVETDRVRRLWSQTFVACFGQAGAEARIKRARRNVR